MKVNQTSKVTESRFNKGMALAILSFAVLSVSVVLNFYQWYHYSSDREHVAASLLKVKQDYQHQQTVMTNLRQKADDHLVSYQVKLAQLHSEVNRINALGLTLAKVANIPENEYDVLQNMAQGGPVSDQYRPLDTKLGFVLEEIDQIDLALTDQAHKMSLLESVLMNHHIKESSQISGKPVMQGWLSSYYGMRNDPFTGKAAMHKGLDFAGSEGDPVITTGAGVVTWSAERSGYGNLIQIDHGNGVSTRYGHNRTLLVKVGDVVEKGQTIAELGNTGRSTGAHVHYEVLHKGIPTNPLRTVYRTRAN